LDFGSVGKALHIWKTLKPVFGFNRSWKSISHLENFKNYIWILAQLEKHFVFEKLKKTTFGFWLNWKSISHLENFKNFIWILAQLEKHYKFGKLKNKMNICTNKKH
jgi:hypothetical protein